MTFDVFLYAGIESFSKLGDSIYFEGKGTIPSLYIIQYISSSFSWRAAGIQLSQKTKRVYSFDPYLHVSITTLANEVLREQPFICFMNDLTIQNFDNCRVCSHI